MQLEVFELKVTQLIVVMLGCLVVIWILGKSLFEHYRELNSRKKKDGYRISAVVPVQSARSSVGHERSRIMNTPNWSEIEADRDRAEALPESAWVSETPETDAAVAASGSLWSFPLRECSRRLERQRNELAALFKKGK